MCVINNMHTEKDLYELLEALTDEAEEKGFDLIVEQSEMDDQLYIVANAKTNKASCVGITEINNVQLIVSYSLNVGKLGWFFTEGFSAEQITDTDNIRNDIFDWLPADEIIDFLHKK